MNCDLADFVECNGLFNNDEQTQHVRIDSFGKLEFVKYHKLEHISLVCTS